VSFPLAEQYCIDGQRLTNNTQLQANQSEYTASGGLYSSIIVHGSLDSAPDYFEVTSDGNIYTFGSDITSRILVDQSKVVHTWLLGSVMKDNEGNAVTLEYDSSDYKYLLAIRHHGMSVEFSYSDRIDSATHYFNGSVLYTMDKVLTAATSYYKPGFKYRDLRLNHEPSGSASLSLLNSYDVCDGNNECFSRTSFNYQGSIDVEGTEALVVNDWTKYYTYNDAWNWKHHKRLPVDVNGDGATDIVGFGYPQFWLSLNSHQNYFFAPIKYDCDITRNDWRMNDSYRNVADLNGDGLVDIFGIHEDGVSVSISDGGTIKPQSTQWTAEFRYNKDLPTLIKDVNGDGLPDIIRYGTTSVQVAINTGSSFQAAKVVSSEMTYSKYWRVEKHQRFVEDVNGDGRPDLVGFGEDGVYVALNIDGESFTAAYAWSSQFGHGFIHEGEKIYKKPYLRDVNGDGLPDITGVFGHRVIVALNTGSSFTQAELWYQGGSFIAFYKLVLQDMNGDGFADIVGFDCCGVRVHLNTGRSFREGDVYWTNKYGSRGDWEKLDYPTFVTDMNGDGVADVIGFGRSFVSVSVNQNRRLSLKNFAGESKPFLNMLNVTKYGTPNSLLG
jgi:hypothetical protein